MSGLRVLAVMPHGPAYASHAGEEPLYKWTTASGQAGFWPEEWMDLLGAEVLKVCGSIGWEVWQPDERADRVLSAQLPSGVSHSLFPAEEGSYGGPPADLRGMRSRAIVTALEALEGQRVLVLLYGTYGFRAPLFLDILAALRGRSLPLFLRSGGMFRAPLTGFCAPHRPLTYLRMLTQHAVLKPLLRRADAISEQSSTGLAEVRKIYSGRVEKLTMGCDFSFWLPPTEQERATARVRLGVGADRKVFFASGNFVPRKQLDRLAEVFTGLGERAGAFLLIAGRGDDAETARLRRLFGPLAATGSGLLHPFASGVELLSLYHAADVYVSVATDEGGPASVMKALACSVPVLTTPVGETADSLREHGAGRFVPIADHASWPPILANIISGNLPRAMDQAAARARYDWPNVAARYIKLFEELEAEYYGNEDGA